MERPLEAPTTQETLCSLCGICASVCPTAAVTLADAVITEPERCILCQACVKNCPTGARVMEVERIKKVADWLSTNYARRKEPEIFLLENVANGERKGNRKSPLFSCQN